MFVRRDNTEFESGKGANTRISIPSHAFFTTLHNLTGLHTPCWLLALANIHCAFAGDDERKKWDNSRQPEPLLTAYELYVYIGITPRMVRTFDLPSHDECMRFTSKSVTADKVIAIANLLFFRSITEPMAAAADVPQSLNDRPSATLTFPKNVPTLTNVPHGIIIPGVPFLLHDSNKNHYAVMYQLPLTCATINPINHMAQEYIMYHPIIADPKSRRFDVNQVATGAGLIRPMEYHSEHITTFDMYTHESFIDDRDKTKYPQTSDDFRAIQLHTYGKDPRSDSPDAVCDVCHFRITIGPRFYNADGTVNRCYLHNNVAETGFVDYIPGGTESDIMVDEAQPDYFKTGKCYPAVLKLV